MRTRPLLLVHRSGADMPLAVRADEFPLEDVFAHILISLSADETGASIAIRNSGPNIPDELIGRIFEYGVSYQADAAANGNRGQGLFVAKTYMAKMGGTIGVRNEADGVSFVLGLQRVRG